MAVFFTGPGVPSLAVFLSSHPCVMCSSNFMLTPWLGAGTGCADSLRGVSRCSCANFLGNLSRSPCAKFLGSLSRCSCAFLFLSLALGNQAPPGTRLHVCHWLILSHICSSCFVTQCTCLYLSSVSGCSCIAFHSHCDGLSSLASFTFRPSYGLLSSFNHLYVRAAISAACLLHRVQHHVCLHVFFRW